MSALELISGIAVGGGVAVASGFVGQIMGFTRGKAEKNLAALFVTGSASDLYCTCEHAMSFHLKGSGSCQEYLRQSEVSTEGGRKGRPVVVSNGKIMRDQYGHGIRCPCQTFVGDPSKNPTPKPLPAPGGHLDLG